MDFLVVPSACFTLLCVWFELDTPIGAPEPHEPFSITIEAVCSSVAPDDGKSTCRAIVGPPIEFDQAAFDATHGANSYVLSDYWKIGQSDNLGIVPAPVMGIFGVAAVQAGEQDAIVYRFSASDP